LLANNTRDIAYDSRVKIRTLSILLGPERSFLIYAGLTAAAYLSVIGMVSIGLLSPWGLLVLLSLPKAIGVLRSFRGAFPEMADAITAKLETVFGLLFIVGLILNEMISL
jgi:1,4-dihydroxy-2-naphthoate octaprenyltransferase